jgi:hypothetical protein
MALITVEVTAARMVAGFGSAEDPRWRIILEVKPKWPTRLKLGTGEEVGRLVEPGQVVMTVTLKEFDERYIEWVTERTKDVKGRDFEDSDAPVIGSMHFHPEWEGRFSDDGRPASIGFDTHTPKDVMASMIRFAEQGRFIREMTFGVRGLSYDGRPDGSGVEWPENEKVRILPVVSVSYLLPLVEVLEDNPEPGAPKTPVGADLVPLLREILVWVKRAVWVLVGIVLLMSVINFRS